MVGRRWVFVVAVSVLVSCADTAADDGRSATRVSHPLAAGRMPAISDPPAVSDPVPTEPPPVTEVASQPSGPAAGVTRAASDVPGSAPAEPEAVGRRSRGSRLLGLGDSIMASVSSRYTDDLCRALVPLGWDVEVEAESGRFVDFGSTVVSKLTKPPLPPAPWDVVLVGLGSNYRGNPVAYRASLESLIASVAPAQVVLVSVTPFEPNRRDVDDVIAAIAAAQPGRVTVMDWATASQADGLLGGDGLHLTDPGRQAYAALAATVLGAAPPPAPPDALGSVPPTPTVKTVAGTYTAGTGPAGLGRCRASAFVDDSAGPVTGSPTVRPRSTSSSVPRSTVTQTTRRVTTTTKPRKPRPRPTSPPTTAAPSTTAPPSGT